MAVLVSNGAGNLTDASRFVRAEAYNIGLFSSTSLAVSTFQSIAFTPTTGSRKIQGVVLALSQTVSAPTATLTASLQESVGNPTLTIASPGVVNLTGHGLAADTPVVFATTGALPTGITAGTIYFVKAPAANSFNIAATAGGANINFTGTQSGTHTLWVVRGSQTQTAATLINSVANATADGWIIPFTWTGYTVDTTAGKWRFGINASASAQYSLRTSNATNPFFVEISDIAATFANDDCLVLKDQITINSSFSVKGVLGTGDAANGVAMIVCKSSTAPRTSNTEGNFYWPNSAPYTMTVDGMIVLGAHSGMRIGTSGTPITYANQATLSFINRTVGTTASSIVGFGAVSNSTSDRKASILFYGESPTNPACLLAAQVSAGATTFTTTTDLTAGTAPWAIGHRVFLGKQDVAGAGDTSIYTISNVSWSGSLTTVTLSSSVLTNARKSGGPVLRLEGYGIKMIGNTTNIPVHRVCGPSNFVLKGVQSEDQRFNLNFSQTVSFDDAANRSQYLIQNCVHNYFTSASQPLVTAVTVPIDGFLIKDSYGVRTFMTPTTVQFVSGTSGVGRIENCTNATITTATGASVNKMELVNNKFLNANSNFFSFAGVGLTVTGNEFWGCTNSAIVLAALHATTTFSGNKFNRSGTGITPTVTSLLNVLRDNIFGDEAANTADFGFTSDQLVDIELASPTGAAAMSATAQNTAMTPGSRFHISDYNNVVGVSRTYYAEGYLFTETGGVDSSGENGLRATTNQTTSALTNRYNCTTASISTSKFAITVNAKIANAAYYAGTNTLPHIDVTHSGGTVVSAAASASTAAQALTAIFTPTTDNDPVVIELSQKTDASTANSDVVWSDLRAYVRKYGNVFQSYSPVIDRTIPSAATLLAFTTPSANAQITVASSATVAAYTEFTINHGTQTVTITADTTLDRLYDYSQYDLTQDANMIVPEWFTTTDGSNFTSSYNIVLNTGVDLTGGGTITVTGGKSLTLSGTATYDGIYTDSSGRSVILGLTGIISGSTVQIYNTTDSTEIYNSVLAATSLNLRYTYLSNKAIRVRVRSPEYLALETSGTITDQGYSLVVNQQEDAVYVANAIDGSLVTEFSLDGSTIMIFADDPDDQTSAQRMYNWYKAAVSTPTYIGLQDTLVTAQTPWSYQFDNSLQIHNQKTAVLFLTGANVNNEAGNGQVIDTAGGPININGSFPFNSAADVARAVWDRSTDEHSTSGTFGVISKNALTTQKFIGLK